MKKLLVFAIAVVLLFLMSGFHSSNLEKPTKLFAGGEYVLYYNSTYANLNYFNGLGIKTNNNGDSFFVVVNFEDYNKIINSGIKPKSYSVKFETNSNNKDNLLLQIKNYYNYKVVWQENVGNINILYAKSPKNLNDLFVNGKKINLTIALSKNNIVIGYPVILHSF